MLLRPQRAVAALGGAVLTVISLIASIPVSADAPSSTRPSVPAIACPFDGDGTIYDDYGDRRSGGRRHQGVDIVADRGTPILAVRNGDVLFKQTRLGGNSAWLTTDHGAKFFYAHLDSFEGESRRVNGGDVIGYLGSTGNAKGPHLHFEAHFTGTPEDPYPAVSVACTPEPPPPPPERPTPGPAGWAFRNDGPPAPFPTTTAPLR